MMMQKNDLRSIREKVEIAEEMKEKNIKRDTINNLLSGVMIGAGIISIVITKVL